MRRRMPRILTLATAMAVTLATSAVGAADDHAEYRDFLDFLERRTDVDGELALRIIALGLYNKNERSPSELGPQDVICEFGEPTGTQVKHVLCGEVQDMQAGTGLGTSTFRSSGMTQLGDQGASYAIAVPAQRAKVQRMIGMLPGLPSMNERLVQLGLRGKDLPRGLPTEREMRAFVEAYRQVSAIGDRYDPRIQAASGSRRGELLKESDAAMAEAIQSTGLSVTRYNEIAGHVQTYPELFEYVKRALSAGG